MADVTAARLVIPVTTSANQASADLNKLNSTLLKLDKSTEKLTESLEQNKKKTKEQSKSLSGLKKAFAAVGVALLARQFVKLTDTYAGVNNKLKLVTNGTKELEQRQKELFDISQKSRSSFQSTAELYARLSRSTKELNVSNDDLLTVTDSINKAFLVSGASAEEASNAIRQLSQGLAAGALRGDEFNSVAEQAPRLQEAIAASLGVTVGELRAMAAEGKITSKVIIEAMTGQAKTINDEFAQLTPTFGQVAQTLENTLLKIVGAVGDDVLPEVGRLGKAFVLLSGDGGILTKALSKIIKVLALAINGFTKLSIVVEGYINDYNLQESLDLQSSALKKLNSNLQTARKEFGLTAKTRPQIVQALEEIARTQGKVNSAFSDPSSRKRAKELLKDIEKQSLVSKLAGKSFDDLATRQATLTETMTELTKDLNIESDKNVKSQAAAFANEKKRAKSTKELADTQKLLTQALNISAAAGDPTAIIKLQRQAFADQKKLVAQAGLDVAILEKFQQSQRISQLDNFFKQVSSNQDMSFTERQAALQEGLAGILEQENLSNEERLAAQKVYTQQSAALEQERYQALANSVSQGASVLGDFNQIAQNLSQVRQNQMEQEIDNLEAQGASEEEIAQKRKELQRKAALDQRKFSIFAAVLDTSVAITKALASVPPPAAYALAAISAAKGATQIAAIKSQPIPKAQFGGTFVVPPGNEADSGLVRVNQGEKVSVTPVGESSQDNNRPQTLIIDGQTFEGYLVDAMQRNLNNGKLTIHRSGVVRAS